MTTLAFIYLICFGVGFLFTLVSAFMADIFGGHEVHVDLSSQGHAEAGFGTNDMPGFSPLSPTTLACFVTAFGGIGLLLTQFPSTNSVWISAPLAVLGGLAIATMVFFLFEWVFAKTQSSSEAHVSDMIGQTATIITPIPTNGVGEIAYVLGGTRYTAPARTENGSTVPNGQSVQITRIAGNEFFVIPF